MPTGGAGREEEGCRRCVGMVGCLRCNRQDVGSVHGMVLWIDRAGTKNE